MSYRYILCHTCIGIKSLLKRRSPRSPTLPTKGGKERKHSKKEIHILRSEALVKTLRKGILQHHASIRSDSRALSSGRSNSNTSGRMGGTPADSFRVEAASHSVGRSGSSRLPCIVESKSLPAGVDTDAVDTDVSSAQVLMPVPAPVAESKDQVEPVYYITNTSADKDHIDDIQPSPPKGSTVPNTHAQDDPLPRPLHYSLKEVNHTDSTHLYITPDSEPDPDPCSPDALSPLSPLSTFDSFSAGDDGGGACIDTSISPLDDPNPAPIHRETSTTATNRHIPVIQRNDSVGTDCPSTTIDIDKYSAHINEVRRNSVVLGQINIQQDDVAVIPRLDAKNDRNIVAWVSMY